MCLNSIRALLNVYRFGPPRLGCSYVDSACRILIIISFQLWILRIFVCLIFISDPALQFVVALIYCVIRKLMFFFSSSFLCAISL